MLMHEEMTFEGSGRLSVETRMKLIHGEVTTLKAKSSIKVTLPMMVGQVLTPDQVSVLFGSMIYDDWGGELNRIQEPSQLVAFESNKASCYLIFKQLS